MTVNCVVVLIPSLVVPVNVTIPTSTLYWVIGVPVGVGKDGWPLI